MSSFKRSSSGLNNQHLFYNVDLIVFLEGGKISYNKEQVYDGSYSSETEDIIFWRKIFEKYAHGKKIKFKSVGSKTTVKEIAEDIISGNLTTVLIGMDNEFDEVLKNQMNHPNIYYTHGYSYENDIWNHQVIKGIIEQITAVKIDGDEIEQNMTDFIQNIQLAVYADGYLFKKKSSFFPRKSGIMFCVECNPANLPYVKPIEIENRLGQKGLTKRMVKMFGKKYSLDIMKHCFGHLLADYSCQLINHYIKKKHSLGNISKEILYRMGIAKNFEIFFNGSEIEAYYTKQFEDKGLFI